MNSKRPTSTKTIIAMGIGAVFALGLAIYAIMSTLNATGSSPNTIAKINPGGGGAAQITVANNGPGSEHPKESVMAVHADPFAPLSINPQSSAAADTRALMDPHAGGAAPMPGMNQAGAALPGGNGQSALPGPGGYPVGPQVQPSNAGSPMANAGAGRNFVPGSNGGVMQTRPMPGLPGTGQTAPASGQAGPSGQPGSQQKNPFGQSAAVTSPARQVFVEGSTIRGPAPKVNGWIQTSSEQPVAGRGSGRNAKAGRAVSLGNPSQGNPFSTASYSPTTESHGSVPPMEIESPSAEPPTLMGTLLGQHPSAVFKGSKGVRVVEVGDSISGWKLVKVAHGKAVMKLAGRQVSLGLIGKGAAGMIVKSNESPTGPFAHVRMRHYLPQQTGAADADTGWIYSKDDAQSTESANPFEAPVSSKPIDRAPAQGTEQDRSPAGEPAKQPMPIAQPLSGGDKPKSDGDEKAAPGQTGGGEPPANPGKG